MAAFALAFQDVGMPRAPARAPQRRRPRRNFIREWRKHRGLTQEQLAARTDMDPSNISQMENAKTGYSWQSLEDIALALDCEPGDLLSGPPTEHELRSMIRRLPDDAQGEALDIIRIIASRR